EKHQDGDGAQDAAGPDDPWFHARCIPRKAIRSKGSSITREGPLPFHDRARPQFMQAQMSRPPIPWPPFKDQVSSAYSSHFSQICTRSAILKPRSFIFFFTSPACSSQGGSGSFFPMGSTYHRPGGGARSSRASTKAPLPRS